MKEYDTDSEIGQKDIEQEYNKRFETPKYQQFEVEKKINLQWLCIVIICLVIISTIYYIIHFKVSHHHSQ